MRNHKLHTLTASSSARHGMVVCIFLRGSLAGTIEGVRDAVCIGSHNQSIQRGRFCSNGDLRHDKRALAPATTVIAALAFSFPASAMDLIQCPDWQSYLPKSTPIALRTSAPAESFESRIARAIATADTSSSGKRQPLSATHSFAHQKTSTRPRGAGRCKTYTVRAGDTLGKIAARELGNSARHPELLAANAGKVKSAETLRVGTVLTIPCAAPEQAMLAASPQKRRPWWKANSKTNAEVQVAAADPAAVAAPKPTPAPLPHWTAKKGEHLSDVLTRWGKKAGYNVIVDGPAEWKLGVRFAEVGSFENVVEQLVKGFARDGLPPSVRIHSNKVLKIGASS